MKKRGYNVFFLLGLICINLASLLILSILNYRFFYLEEEKVFETKFRSSSAKEIENYIDSVDVQLREIIQIPIVFFSETNENQNFLSPASKTIVGSSPDIRTLINDLSKIKRIYPYLYSLDIYYPSTNTAVTNFINVHETLDDTSLKKFLPWLDKINEDVINGQFIENGINSYPIKTKTITYVQKIAENANSRGDIFVALHINPTLLESFPDNTLFEVTSFVFDKNDEKIYENSLYPWQKEFIDKNLSSTKDLDNKFFENNDGKFIIWSNEDGILNYYGFIGYKGLYPGYNEDSSRLTRNFILWIIYNFVFLALLTILNYYFYKHYVESFFKDINIKNKSSLKSSLEKISKEYENLGRETKEYQKEAIIKSLLTNKAESASYEEVYSTIGNKSVYSVILSPLDNSKDFNEKQVKEVQNSFKRECELILTSFFYPYRLVLVEITDKNVVSPFLIESLEKIDNVALSVGNVYLIEPNGFQNSYLSAMDAFNYRFLCPSKKIISYKELNLEEKKPFGNHVNKLTQAERLIKLGERDALNKLLNELFEDLKDGNYSLQYIKATLSDIVNTVYILLLKNKLDMYLLYGYDIKERANKESSIETYEIWLNELINKAIFALEENKEKYENSLSQKINSFVEEKLNQDISLSMIAESLGMREDALSRNFKSIMGSNYMKYITEKKMDKAIELLEKGMSINKIASFLGYRSAQYFIKIFKTTYGVTPNTFKKHQRNGGKEE